MRQKKGSGMAPAGRAIGTHARRVGVLGSMCLALLWGSVAAAQVVDSSWRPATDKELKSLLPARATV